MASSKASRGVEGRVKEMVGKFSNGQKASTPIEAERRRLEAQKAKAMAARYNMVLRGQQMMQMKMQQKQKEGQQQQVEFKVHEMTEEWEDYPWHLAAAFTDDDDAFWMPELALALEQQDEKEINRAVLRFFLEENDPERLGDLDQLLDQFAGSEEVLFVNLQKEYVSPTAAAMEIRKQPVIERDGESAGTSTVGSFSSGGEEEKTPDLATAGNRRRPSYVVSGMKKESGWSLNAADDELKQKMEDSGATPKTVEVLVSVASANYTEAFAPGGVY